MNFNQSISVWCRDCQSYHVIPVSREHHKQLKCRAIFNDLRTGEGIAQELKKYGTFILPFARGGFSRHIEKLDFDIRHDDKYLDRVFAVHRETGCKLDISHTRFIYGSDLEYLWEPIHIAPIYTAVPEGEIIHYPERVYPIGTEFKTTKELGYYGETLPKGTQVTMAGFKTTRIIHNYYLKVAFEACARFEDGTYRTMLNEDSIVELKKNA